MISYIFYIFFIICIITTPFFIVYKKLNQYLIFNLIVCAQFNATIFFKAGLTFSFFEIVLFLASFTLVFSKLKIIKSVRLNYIDYIFTGFLFFCLLSVFFAEIRITLGNLVTSGFLTDAPFFRSLMSLNKVFVFVPLLIFIRSYLLKNFDRTTLNNKFIFFLAVSGIFPALATLIQFSGIGFDLIHNNPSFAETFKIIHYKIERPVGLTNEASFMVFQLFFPFFALFEARRKMLLKNTAFFSFIVIYLLAVLVSLSRTGLVFYLLFMMLYQFKEGIKIKTLIGITVSLGVAFFVVKDITISGFNVTERLLSSFNIQADLSTIERYGSAEAMIKMILDKSLVLGVGIYNYGYYITSYLPSYMDVIHYSKERTVPSFNFVLQLIAEFGVPLFVIFISGCVWLIRKSNSYFVGIYFLFIFLFALTFQVLNFAIPFLILLYSPTNYEKNSLRN